MANQYGTKAWAKWASRNLEFVLSLLKEPEKQWDEKMTYLEGAIKTIAFIGEELKEVSRKS